MVHPPTATLEKVRAYEGSLTLPTYEIRGEDPNPIFHSQYGVAHIYPYTLLVDIAPTARPRVYRSLNLENRYLRVTVMPDLGGRVYSLYDKISQREVFYRNDVVKFAPLAIRGAFFSGGLEFSFPVAHQPTTADPVNWDLRENEDGSATLFFGGLEHMGRMRWTISLTLYPDRCALAQDVQLQNPSPVPGRYHYWTNASLTADDQTEFIYPLRRFRSYEFAGTASWPAARVDTILQDPGLPGMEGVPRWPAERLHSPLDLRWQKNMLAQVSIFGRDVEWDFFGAWQHGADVGYAHFADHRDVAGMKLWSWGQAGSGISNQAALTDDRSLYAETQCGAMETQLDFDFLPPGRVRRWREWWLPLRGLGGLTCASAELGASVALSPTEDSQVYRIRLGLCPAAHVGTVSVTLATPDRVLFQTNMELAPEEPWSRELDVAGRELGARPLTLKVVDQSGSTILNYTLDRQSSAVEPSEIRAPEEPRTAEDWYQLGLKHENFDNREQAREAYAAALELDGSHGGAHLRLGLMLLRAADYDMAESEFKQAIAAGRLDANCHLGTLYLYRDDPASAVACFAAVPEASESAAAARSGLGRIALGRGEWDRAVESFDRALAIDPTSIHAHVLRGIAFARAGHVQRAREEFEKVIELDPLNHPALWELSHLPGTAEAYKEKPDRMLADDRQYWLDLACFYLDARLVGDAEAILKEAAEAWDYAMLAYLIGDAELRHENEGVARKWLRRAAAASLDLVFPSRLEEVNALMHALEADRSNAQAKYALGNFFYAHQRFDEAIRLWEEAAPALPSFDVLYRNLGLAYRDRCNDPERAIGFFEKALALNPNNQDLYAELNRLYAACGLSEKRAALLDRILALREPRDDVHKLSIFMLVEMGDYESAIQKLTSEQFVASEMDQSFRNAYVRAYLARADARVKAGRTAEAIADYKQALEYPENVGVGRPVSPRQAQILYLLGCAYEQIGGFQDALAAWKQAVCEHHPHGSELFTYLQMSLDKLNRYSEIRFF